MEQGVTAIRAATVVREARGSVQSCLQQPESQRPTVWFNRPDDRRDALVQPPLKLQLLSSMATTSNGLLLRFVSACLVGVPHTASPALCFTISILPCESVTRNS